MFKHLLLSTICVVLAVADFTITDMRGKAVTIKEPLNSVATIDDGFVEGVMTHLGVIDKITAIGSWSMKRDYKYDFVAQNGENTLIAAGIR